MQQENKALRSRLTKLSEASIRITEQLDVGSVLQEVIDSACLLTNAQYGALLVFDESGGMQDFVTSGITPEQVQLLGTQPKRLGILGYLNEIRGPLRLRDIATHSRSIGFPKNHPPMKTFLGTPVRHRGEAVGNIYLTEKQGGEEFTLEDEDVLVMFASQAALVIANTVRYTETQRVKDSLEAVIRSSPVGVVVIDADTRTVTSINDESKRIFAVASQPGGALEEYSNRVSVRYIDGREVPSDQRPIERALRYGETVRAEEVVYRLRNGGTVTVLMNVTPIRSDDGKIVSAVVVIQDLTPVEEVERLRAQFLGMVSHELRGPLTVIKGSAATALTSTSPIDPTEMRQLFRIVDGPTDLLRDQINNLLDMTQIEAGKLSVTPEVTNVVDLISEARNGLLRGGLRNNTEVEVPPDLPRVWADSQRIVQVLINLLSNAAKYSPEASNIRVAVRRRTSTWPSRSSTKAEGCPLRACHACSKNSPGSISGTETVGQLDTAWV